MTVIGVDIGGSKSLAVRVDDGDVATEERSKLDRSMSIVDAVALAVDKVSDGPLEAIGVGVAGLVRAADGVLVWGPHVSGIDVPIKAILEQRYGVPVVVDNDANTAALAEFRTGAGIGYRDGLLVTLGTGIGGAIVIGGEIYRGGSFAGEWGHARIEEGGLLCDCGKRGCWETRASGPALARLGREVIAANPGGSLATRLGQDEVTGESIVSAADAGEETARALVAEVGRAFGNGLSDLISIFDPEIVVIGGGLGSVGESIVGPARRVVVDSIHGGNLRVPPSIHVAALGQAAGAIGAAMLAKELLHVR
ncbi:MAG: ROK family protein [Actinomycetota bacterium]|nr:ROK family protein [Actinomycetota bacterium]